MDGRANNGNKGHSTKATKATDKRLNPSKAMLAKYIDEEFDYEALKEVLGKLYKDAIQGDTKSATLLLAYVLGKPKESKDITSGGEVIKTIINLGQGKEE